MMGVLTFIMMSSLNKIDVYKEHKRYLNLLHSYNEIKDYAQSLFGKCACVEGTTTKNMYIKFEMDELD